jgi:hypothetical protein
LNDWRVVVEGFWEVGGKSLDSAARDRFFSCPKQTFSTILKSIKNEN